MARAPDRDPFVMIPRRLLGAAPPSVALAAAILLDAERRGLRADRSAVEAALGVGRRTAQRLCARARALLESQGGAAKPPQGCDKNDAPTASKPTQWCVRSDAGRDKTDAGGATELTRGCDRIDAPSYLEENQYQEDMEIEEERRTTPSVLQPDAVRLAQEEDPFADDCGPLPPEEDPFWDYPDPWEQTGAELAVLAEQAAETESAPAPEDAPPAEPADGPYHRVRAALAAVAEAVGGMPPDPAQVRRHLRPSSPLRRLAERYEPGLLAAMYVAASRGGEFVPSWSYVEEHQQLLLARIQGRLEREAEPPAAVVPAPTLPRLVRAYDEFGREWMTTEDRIDGATLFRDRPSPPGPPGRSEPSAAERAAAAIEACARRLSWRGRP